MAAAATEEESAAVAAAAARAAGGGAPLALEIFFGPDAHPLYALDECH
jgi:hypothetical protein